MSNLLHPAGRPCCPPALISPPAAPQASRRRRLWQLSPRAHCPVVGVCLSVATLRRLADKAFGGQVQADDYELHSGAVQDCLQRGALSEALQRELDRRHAAALRAAAAAKTAEALAQWWHAGLQGDDLAGALWATLTHPRCDEALEERVLHDIHLRQHQLGESQGQERRRSAALQQAHDALAAELARQQERAARAASGQARRVGLLQDELASRRAELIGRDGIIASLSERLQALEASDDERRARQALAEDRDRLAARLQQLERSLAQLHGERDAERRRAAVAEARLREWRAAVNAEPVAADEPGGPALSDRAVLCVGGRAASVPVYRRLIEQVGARFLHHDGGEHEHLGVLDHTLASADLVICQTGCISHDAYWRVKDHCKRSGKRCVFVDNPSRSGLQRALRALAEGEAP